MIKFDIDIAGLTANLAAEEKRLAYAVATAMNRTVLEIQREERAQLDRSFTIRKNDFMYRLVKVFAFAKVFKGIGPQQPVFAEIGWTLRRPAFSWRSLLRAATKSQRPASQWACPSPAALRARPSPIRCLQPTSSPESS